jgi:hypothetical protein
MKKYLAIALCVATCVTTSSAQLGRRGGGTRVNLQNRSQPARNGTANVNRNTNVNRNVNVNRTINVNNNVNYHGGGCYNCGYDHDHDWNWGSFAAGAAVGVATTAIVASAHSSHTTVVVAPPAVGTVISALPASCGTVTASGVVIYNCNNIYYRPYYQGTTLVYQVVTYP